MSRRFFSEQLILTDSVQLSGPEAHHLIHVMRAKVADPVILFDGTGAEFAASIEAIGRRDVTLRVQSRAAVDRELPFALVLAVALPRGDRQEWLVQKAVELGVTRLVPWQTERSVARPNDKSLERLRRTVIEASKQCGRNRLMEISAPCDFGDFLPPAVRAYVALGACRRGGREPHLATGSAREHPQPRASIWGLVPRAGLAIRRPSRQRRPVGSWSDMGPRILRTETAALALVAHVVLTAQCADA